MLGHGADQFRQLPGLPGQTVVDDRQFVLKKALKNVHPAPVIRFPCPRQGFFSCMDSRRALVKSVFSDNTIFRTGIFISKRLGWRRAFVPFWTCSVTSFFSDVHLVLSSFHLKTPAPFFLKWFCKRHIPTTARFLVGYRAVVMCMRPAPAGAPPIFLLSLFTEVDSWPKRFKASMVTPQRLT